MIVPGEDETFFNILYMELEQGTIFKIFSQGSDETDLDAIGIYQGLEKYLFVYYFKIEFVDECYLQRENRS